MEILYLKDCYLCEFEARILEVDGNLVFLDRTAFYPASGGQPNDTGFLVKNGEKFSVVNVFKKEGKIAHGVEKQGLAVGDVVKGLINWERRYKLMQMHTASHVLSAVFHMQAKALITGNQLGVEASRLDFNIENFDREMMNEYCELANEVIKKNLPVKIYFLKREDALKIEGIVKLAAKLPPSLKELRIVEIEGFDLQADGGTHVKNTGEIGIIEITKMENKGKNNRRVYFTLT